MSEELNKTEMKSEDALGRMWDRCIADTIVKTGSGLAIGALASLAFFKRKPWPAILGVGIGLGHGVANCQNDYKALASPKVQSRSVSVSTE
ncbi:MICOS complex subunit Mic10-like [Watersipora subatra]|uniref:MICOS complex subunit Mic10-like n=1 Tax=Watersipora subatra TaxID=2589382 RepID=UPI00355BFB46